MTTDYTMYTVDMTFLISDTPENTIDQLLALLQQKVALDLVGCPTGRRRLEELVMSNVLFDAVQDTSGGKRATLLTGLSTSTSLTIVQLRFVALTLLTRLMNVLNSTSLPRSSMRLALTQARLDNNSMTLSWRHVMTSRTYRQLSILLTHARRLSLVRVVP